MASNHTSDEPLEAAERTRNYLLGLGILVLSVLFTNLFGFLQHPEQVFDVHRNTPLANRLYEIGFLGQVVTGLWLGISLVFDFRPGRRLAALLWFASLGLMFVPMPSARDDLSLAPSLFAGLAGLVWLGRVIHDGLRPGAGR